MGLMKNLAGKAGKAALKSTLKAAYRGDLPMITQPIAEKASQQLDKQSARRTAYLMDNEELPFKLKIRQRARTVSEQFKIYDQNDNVVYTAQGTLLAPTAKISLFDKLGNEVGMIRKKLYKVGVYKGRYAGDLVEFEIWLDGQSVGNLTTKYIGKTYESSEEVKEGCRQAFRGSWYECDFIDLEIMDKHFSQKYEIISGGETVAVFDENMWEIGDCYILAHANDDYEPLFVLLVLAMDSLRDDSTLRERVVENRLYGAEHDW